MAGSQTTDGAYRRRWGLYFILAVTLALVIVSEVSYQRARAGIQDSERITQQHNALKSLRLWVLQAETSQRGFLLTRQPDYRTAYALAVAETRRYMEATRELYQGANGPTPELTEIVELTQRKLSELDAVVQLAEGGSLDAAVALMAAGLGKEFMRALEAELERLSQAEQRNIVQEQGALSETLNQSRFGIAMLTVLILLSLGLYVQQGRRVAEERALQRQALQRQNDRLEEEVVIRTREITEIARHLQRAREDERQNLARELHDELGALLTVAKLDLARIRRRKPDMSPEFGERIEHLAQTLDEGIALKRRIIEDLRPSTLSHLGLPTALEVLCREFAQRSGIEVKVDVQEVALSDELELTCYRLVQESLTNVVKYAKARTVRVSLNAKGQNACLVIADDGVGFDPQVVRPAAHGLAGMRFRVSSVEGTLRIVSSPGAGTRIEATVPLEPESEDKKPDAPVAHPVQT